jgi:16S rRNA (guanine966-N2)-methyltransferase
MREPTPSIHLRADPAANRVRIIGGAFRRRVIRFPSVPGVGRRRIASGDALQLARPGPRGQGAVSISYAGSGALTLEAASRGAALAVAVDRDRALVDALRATSHVLGATAVEAIVGEARAFIANERREFDVIFLDPPFRDDPWAWLCPPAQLAWRRTDCCTPKRQHALSPPSGLVEWRRDKAGRVHYHLFTRGDAAPA